MKATPIQAAGFGANGSAAHPETYRTLRAARVALLSLELLLFLLVLLGTHLHRAAMQTVGRDAAPSIIAAQHIKAALADLDANEANELLGSPNTASAASAGILRRRDEAESALLSAAENITYTGERKPIETLQQAGSFYNRIAQEAEDLHDAGAPHDIDFYRAEATMIDAVLLPAATELDRVNDDQLERTYRHQSWQSGLSLFMVLLAGVALLGCLVALQAFLSARMHRTLNPLLLLATGSVLVLLILSLGAMGTEQHQLRIAKEDSFDSLHALWQARAIAYQANAEESRFLLDPLHAADYANAFHQETRTLLSLPNNVSLEEALSRAPSGEPTTAFTGLLADEWNNITFRGERDAAAKMIRAFAAYLQIDSQMRDLERKGDHEAAVALCIGSAPGQSDWAFARFDDALGEALAINQKEFDSAVSTGLNALGSSSGHLSIENFLSSLEAKALMLSLLAALCTLFGLAPRIREYE